VHGGSLAPQDRDTAVSQHVCDPHEVSP
jgi:hypothetical protein